MAEQALIVVDSKGQSLSFVLVSLAIDLYFVTGVGPEFRRINHLTLDVVDFQFAHEGYSWVTVSKLTIFDDNMLLRQRVVKQLSDFASGNGQTRNDSEILIQL